MSKTNLALRVRTFGLALVIFLIVLHLHFRDTQSYQDFVVGQKITDLRQSQATYHTSSDHLSSEVSTNSDDEPAGKLVRPGEAPRINATFLILVRNSELSGILSSMESLERVYNRKFGYPYTFFNEEPFTENFKRRTQAATNAPCRYESIPREHWDVPEWVDKTKLKESQRTLRHVPHGGELSYRKMCRWNSGFFYKHPALADMEYYWRVEPNVQFFCDIDYDLFAFMKDNNKAYSFTITLRDISETISTLWLGATGFLKQSPQYLHPNNSMGWLEDPDNKRNAHGYNTCHFWSNFEIGSLDFFRSEAYEAYFKHHDRLGGFFYERWGDAPVHSIAAAMLLDQDQIHWAADVGYFHSPYYNCPSNAKCRGCVPGEFTKEESLKDQTCLSLYLANKENLT